MPHEVRGRIVAGCDQLHDVRDDLVLGQERSTLFVSCGDHLGDQIVSGVHPAVFRNGRVVALGLGDPPPPLAAFLLADRAELCVVVLVRLDRRHEREHVLGPVAEAPHVGSIHAQQVDDRPERQGVAVGVHEIAAAGCDEAVDELFRSRENARLHRLDARAREPGVRFLARHGVLGRVERDERVAGQARRHLVCELRWRRNRADRAR